ncbi:hypothetical protein D915_002566 [Fasciola hepatica]|uniref:C2H2-type domain-containing protein n=1 Tax=Fasciola hepatica TaxID=6192 RepID=A0A4E0RGC4_FASHE|nr:hypothetical protein D915_002566 [Fasciola hepatica]
MSDSTGPLDLRLQTQRQWSGLNKKLTLGSKQKRTVDGRRMEGLKRPLPVEPQTSYRCSTSTTAEVFICPICRSQTTSLQFFIEHMATHVKKSADTGRENSSPLAERNTQTAGRKSMLITDPTRLTPLTDSAVRSMDTTCTNQARQCSPIFIQPDLSVPGQEARHTCSLCFSDRLYPSIWELVAHVQSTHLRCYYQCDRCGQTFAEKLGGLDHIFAVHFDASTVSSTTLQRSQPKSIGRSSPPGGPLSQKIPGDVLSDEFHSKKRNMHVDRSLQTSDQQNTPHIREDEGTNWSDAAARENSTALLSYLSVQTQAMDLISQLLWLTAMKPSGSSSRTISDNNDKHDSNWNPLDEKYAVSERKPRSPPQLLSPTGSLGYDKSEGIETATTQENNSNNNGNNRSNNNGQTCSQNSSPFRKRAYCRQLPESNSPQHKKRPNPASDFRGDKSVTQNSKTEQTSLPNLLGSVGPYERDVGQTIGQPIEPVTNLLFLFRNCSPLLNSHPVRSLLPTELASKVDSFEAAKLCHLCLREFPDEMSVLRHQVESHSLNGEPTDVTWIKYQNNQ